MSICKFVTANDFFPINCKMVFNVSNDCGLFTMDERLIFLKLCFLDVGRNRDTAGNTAAIPTN